MNPRNLIEARIQAHYAAQVLAAVGTELVPAKKDFSHTSMNWNDKTKSFETQKIPKHDFIVRLNLKELTLYLKDSNNELTELKLQGKTMKEAFHWATEKIKEITNKELTLTNPIPAYGKDFPMHDIVEGEEFNQEESQEALEELGNYYSTTYEILKELYEEEPVTWPHHFDMAILLKEGVCEDGEEKTIGCGMSPGDDYYNEPYWYVGPWPRPKEEVKIEEGRWDGTLKMPVLPSANVQEEYEEAVRRFFKSNVEIFKKILKEF